MSLSINALGLKNVPVISSDSTRALDQGVVHLPGTSYPWSDTPERNVYLAGHRLGWPGTGSHLVFYRLNELGRGDRITLRDRDGRRYDYMVIESFEVGPLDRWVTGEGSWEGSADLTDMHAYPHLREALDRPRRKI